jgi:hypothetical protein
MGDRIFRNIQNLHYWALLAVLSKGNLLITISSFQHLNKCKKFTKQHCTLVSMGWCTVTFSNIPTIGDISRDWGNFLPNEWGFFSLNNTAKEYKLQISTKKTKVLGFKGVEHLRAKIEISNQILKQVTCFNYLGCNISYVRFEDPEIKLAEFLQLIATIKRVRKETVLKFYKTLAVPDLLYGAENWTLTVPQKKRIEAAEMKLWRPLAGYTLRDHKYNNDIHFELGLQSIM